MRHARSQLPQRSQFVGARCTLALFFLTRHVASYSQHPGGAAFNNQRRIVDTRVAPFPIARQVTHLVCLRLTAKCLIEFMSNQVAIAFMNKIQEVPADKILALQIDAAQRGGIAPLETAIIVDRIN